MLESERKRTRVFSFKARRRGLAPFEMAMVLPIFTLFLVAIFYSGKAAVVQLERANELRAQTWGARYDESSNARAAFNLEPLNMENVKTTAQFNGLGGSYREGAQDGAYAATLKNNFGSLADSQGSLFLQNDGKLGRTGFYFDRVWNHRVITTNAVATECWDAGSLKASGYSDAGRQKARPLNSSQARYNQQTFFYLVKDKVYRNALPYCNVTIATPKRNGADFQVGSNPQK